MHNNTCSCVRQQWWCNWIMLERQLHQIKGFHCKGSKCTQHLFTHVLWSSSSAFIEENNNNGTSCNFTISRFSCKLSCLYSMSSGWKAVFLAKRIKSRKAPARLYFQISRSQLRGSIWRGPVCPPKAWVTAPLSGPSVQEWNCDEWEKILLENWKEFQKQHRLELLYTSTTFQ